MNDEGPHEQEDMLTPAMQAAISSHEMFTALKSAGFTRYEALRIIIGILTAHSGERGDE